MEIDLTQIVTQLGLSGLILYLVVSKLNDIENRIRELNETIREMMLRADLK